MTEQLTTPNVYTINVKNVLATPFIEGNRTIQADIEHLYLRAITQAALDAVHKNTQFGACVVSKPNLSESDLEFAEHLVSQTQKNMVICCKDVIYLVESTDGQNSSVTISKHPITGFQKAMTYMKQNVVSGTLDTGLNPILSRFQSYFTKIISPQSNGKHDTELVNSLLDLERFFKKITTQDVVQNLNYIPYIPSGGSNIAEFENLNYLHSTFASVDEILRDYDFADFLSKNKIKYGEINPQVDFLRGFQDIFSGQSAKQISPEIVQQVQNLSQSQKYELIYLCFNYVLKQNPHILESYLGSKPSISDLVGNKILFRLVVCPVLGFPTFDLKSTKVAIYDRSKSLTQNLESLKNQLKNFETVGSVLMQADVSGGGFGGYRVKLGQDNNIYKIKTGESGEIVKTLWKDTEILSELEKWAKTPNFYGFLMVPFDNSLSSFPSIYAQNETQNSIGNNNFIKINSKSYAQLTGENNACVGMMDSGGNHLLVNRIMTHSIEVFGEFLGFTNYTNPYNLDFAVSDELLSILKQNNNNSLINSLYQIFTKNSAENGLDLNENELRHNLGLVLNPEADPEKLKSAFSYLMPFIQSSQTIMSAETNARHTAVANCHTVSTKYDFKHFNLTQHFKLSFTEFDLEKFQSLHSNFDYNNKQLPQSNAFKRLLGKPISVLELENALSVLDIRYCTQKIDSEQQLYYLIETPPSANQEISLAIFSDQRFDSSEIFAKIRYQVLSSRYQRLEPRINFQSC